MLTNGLAMLFTFLLVFHEIVVLFVTADLVVHGFDWFFAAGQCLADFGDRWDYLFEFEIVAVMFLCGPTIIAHVGVLIAFIIRTDEHDGIARMLTTSHLYSIQIGSFEHGYSSDLRYLFKILYVFVIFSSIIIFVRFCYTGLIFVFLACVGRCWDGLDILWDRDSQDLIIDNKMADPSLEQKARNALNDAFKHFDFDKSGFIQFHELGMLLTKLTTSFHAVPPSDEDVMDIFKELDLNGDGKISRQEF